MFDLSTLDRPALIDIAKRRALSEPLSNDDLSSNPGNWTDNVIIHLLLAEIEKAECGEG